MVDISKEFMLKVGDIAATTSAGLAFKKIDSSVTDLVSSLNLGDKEKYVKTIAYDAVSAGLEFFLNDQDDENIKIAMRYASDFLMGLAASTLAADPYLGQSYATIEAEPATLKQNIPLGVLV